MAAAIQIVGAKELFRKLRALPTKVSLNVQGKAINRANQVVLKRAKATAPIGKGTYKAQLRKKKKTYKKTLTVVGIVGSRHRQAPHQYFIESGTRQRRRFPAGTSDALKRTARRTGRTVLQKAASALARTQQTGASTGRMPAQHHMARVLRDTRKKVLAEFGKKLGKEIEREAAKLRNA